jgi:hypothetical protein
MEKFGVFTACVLLLVTMDFRNLVPSSLMHCRCEKSILTVLILVLFCQTSCYSCTLFDGQLSTDLVDKSIGVDKSQIVTGHFCKISSHTHAAFTYVPDVLGWQVSLIFWMSIQPFSNSLHVHLTAALSLCHHHSLCQLVLNFYGGHISHVKAEMHYKCLCAMKLLMSLPLNTTFPLNSIWLSDSCAICCMVSPPQTLLPTSIQNAWLTQKVNRLGALLMEHFSYKWCHKK